MSTAVDAASLSVEPSLPNASALAAAETIANRLAPIEPTDARSAPNGNRPIETTETPPIDAGGTPFDVNRHLRKQHPRTGRWMPRRTAETGNGPTNPPAHGSFVGLDEPAPQTDKPTGPAPTGEPAPDVYAAMADLHCKAFYGLAVGLISDEWLPEKAEHTVNRDTLAAAYRASGMKPDSPWLSVALVAAAFAGKRLSQPKTQTRLAMLRAWFERKFAGWKGARRASAIDAATS